MKLPLCRGQPRIPIGDDGVKQMPASHSSARLRAQADLDAAVRKVVAIIAERVDLGGGGVVGISITPTGIDLRFADNSVWRGFDSWRERDCLWWPEVTL